ncbi:MAG: hypothetical protein IJH47_01240 [Oscillospiraceae bacterium]|nr:hypothetical protein [Oscillospiraceae bacterium]
MSGKKTDAASAVWTAVRTGGAAAAITLFLLLPMAILIRRGTVSYDDRILCQGFVLFFAGMIAALVCRCGREGGIVSAILAMIFVGLLFLILSASIPGGKPSINVILPVTAAAGAGIAIGSFIQNNKKLKSRKRKRRNITNSNQRKKFT